MILAKLFWLFQCSTCSKLNQIYCCQFKEAKCCPDKAGFCPLLLTEIPAEGIQATVCSGDKWCPGIRKCCPILQRSTGFIYNVCLVPYFTTSLVSDQSIQNATTPRMSESTTTETQTTTIPTTTTEPTTTEIEIPETTTEEIPDTTPEEIPDTTPEEISETTTEEIPDTTPEENS